MMILLSNVQRILFAAGFLMVWTYASGISDTDGVMSHPLPQEGYSVENATAMFFAAEENERDRYWDLEHDDKYKDIVDEDTQTWKRLRWRVGGSRWTLNSVLTNILTELEQLLKKDYTDWHKILRNDKDISFGRASKDNSLFKGTLFRHVYWLNCLTKDIQKFRRKKYAKQIEDIAHSIPLLVDDIWKINPTDFPKYEITKADSTKITLEQQINGDLTRIKKSFDDFKKKLIAKRQNAIKSQKAREEQRKREEEESRKKQKNEKMRSLGMFGFWLKQQNE